MSFYKSYRKYLFNRDTLFATLSAFLVIGLLAFFPLNTKVLNPIKTALEDFDFNDIAYAKLGKNSNTPLDNRIIIVNIGHGDRADLAGMLENISTGKPKVIGLDVNFNDAKDAASDSFLNNVLKTTPNLVIASHINWENKKDIEVKGFFDNAVNTYGYANFIGEDNGTIRYFSPQEKHDERHYLSFDAALLKTADPDRFQKLLKRHKEIEQINYTRKTNKYFVVDGEDILAGKTDAGLFTNKIVLMGYVNVSQDDIEDKHFTPMNSQFAGKSLPDMNGVIVHANILSMLLDGNYLKMLPAWLNWLITIMIAYMVIALFNHYYIENHLWFHLIAKWAQILSAIFFVYLSILMFDSYSLKLDMKIPIIVIILAIDVIYFYEAFAIWLNRKYHFRTIFNNKPH